MGRPKLLLPYRGTVLLRHVLDAWLASRVDHVVVVVWPGGTEIARMVTQSGATAAIPASAPREMKESVCHGLAHVATHFEPTEADVWLLGPADMPGLQACTIDSVLEESRREAGKIVVPVYRGRRGHPVAFPWSVAAATAELAVGEGVNVLLGRHRVHEVAVRDATVLDDLDTPEDYERLQRGG